MLSESARATSAAEQRYRVDAPNARPRTIKVVALDEDAARLVQQLSKRSWTNAKFLALPNAASVLAPDAASLTDWMRSVAGEAQGLIKDVVGTDVMVLVAKTGGHTQPAIPIGEACAARGIPVVGIVIQSGKALPDLQTLNAMRPFTTMLVVAASEDYLEAMLAAFGA